MPNASSLSVYDQLGGEGGVRALVETFYDIVESDPIGAQLLAMHQRGHGLVHARSAQLLFLSAFLGGPRDYWATSSHQDVRQMHAHLDIGESEAQAWLSCMEKALAVQAVRPDMQEKLMLSFRRIAQLLKNRP